MCGRCFIPRPWLCLRSPEILLLGLELTDHIDRGLTIRFCDDLDGADGLLVGRVIAVVDRGCLRWHRFIVAHETAHAIDNDWRIILPRDTQFYEHCLDAAAGLSLIRTAIDRAYYR